ncbi:MAG: NTP transferase domain-containing protein [Thaumarchaeota archaeon]|nr:NTP transferase domain-containing protein [Nitrososphaerota archaeon]
MNEHARSAIIIADIKGNHLLPRKFANQEEESNILEYVLDSVWTIADEIYVIFDKEPDLQLVEDIAPFGVKIMVQPRSSLVSRIDVCFKASRSEYSLIVSSNRPFVKPNVAFALFEAARGHDAAVPKWRDGRVEPLLAVYRKQTFLKISPQIEDSNRPEEIVDHLYAIRFVQVEDELSQLDPDLNSFFSVNTEEDLQKARALAAVGKHL